MAKGEVVGTRSEMTEISVGNQFLPCFVELAEQLVEETLIY